MPILLRPSERQKLPDILPNLIASTNDNDNDNDTAKFPHELDVDGCIVRPTNCNSSKEVLYITSILQNCQQSNQRVLKVRSQGLSQGPSPQGNPGNVYAIKNYQIISCTVTKSQSKRRCSLKIITFHISTTHCLH